MGRHFFVFAAALFSLLSAGCPQDGPIVTAGVHEADCQAGPCTDCPPEGCDEGEVSECDTAEDCPAISSQCVLGVVCEQHKCVKILESSAKPIEWQTLGDCRMQFCDLEGNVVNWPHTADVPDDGNPCTKDLCEGDDFVPVNVPVDEGNDCTMGDGEKGVCKPGGAGEAPACVACIDGVVDECPGPGEKACHGVYCVPKHCVNQSFDQNLETGFDCGGTCSPCPPGAQCGDGSDCLSGVCTKSGFCAVENHVDGVKNAGETGVDCGCEVCPKCPAGEGCGEPSHCESGACFGGKCQSATCFDQVQNQDEEGPDCGGPCDMSCD